MFLRSKTAHHDVARKKIESAPVSKCSDTYGDLLPQVGLQHPDPAALVTEALQGELWSGLLQLAIAHVIHGDLVALSHRDAAVARDGVVSAAAVPLARVDLKLPGEAPVQDKRASLVVFITPAHGRFAKGHVNVSAQ